MVATRSRRYGSGAADRHVLVSENGFTSWADPIKVSAVTATADGTGTGVVPDGTEFAVVTSADANHIVTLPTPTPGAEVTLQNGATGYELRSSAPATVGINGGAEAAAESAIAANITTKCTCTTATNWVCNSRTAAGVVGVTAVAAAA